MGYYIKICSIFHCYYMYKVPQKSMNSTACLSQNVLLVNLLDATKQLLSHIVRLRKAMKLI